MDIQECASDERCIADELSACSKIFRSLLADPKSNDLEYTAQIEYTFWKEDFNRLRTWSANIVAHQRGNTSLDFRLRDASHIQNRVVELLIELCDLLSDTVNLLEVPRGTEKELNEEDISDEEDQTEYQGLYSSVVLRIDCLFDLSLVIRKPAKLDRLAAFNKARGIAFREFDLRHVEHKFPCASQELQKGLASAITLRRSILKYYENHQGKYARGITKVFDDENAKSEAPQTEFSVNAATEYHELEDVKSTSGDSNQSMRSVMNQGRALHIPIPPEVHGRKPYACPCCHYLLDIYDPRRYARHVFEDITPYQCIFGDCVHKQDLLASKSAWLRHVTEDHLEEWQALCNADNCFMCGESQYATGSFEKHVARHLEDLAMFVLPLPQFGATNNDGNSSVQVIALQDISDIESEHEVAHGLKSILESLCTDSNVLLDHVGQNLSCPDLKSALEQADRTHDQNTLIDAEIDPMSGDRGQQTETRNTPQSQYVASDGRVDYGAQVDLATMWPIAQEAAVVPLPSSQKHLVQGESSVKPSPYEIQHRGPSQTQEAEGDTRVKRMRIIEFESVQPRTQTNRHGRLKSGDPGEQVPGRAARMLRQVSLRDHAFERREARGVNVDAEGLAAHPLNHEIANKLSLRQTTADGYSSA